MSHQELYKKALNREFLSLEEGMELFMHAPTSELMQIGHALRLKVKTDPVVTWIIDRNVNTTNVCVANCKFCNFFRVPGHPDSYITDIETYKRKIDETLKYGGDQLLLQGGHHPELGIEFYAGIFKEIKEHYPDIKLHALGPPEIVHIAKIEKKSYAEVLKALMDAGLDSLPGAGAEVLSDRVRKKIATGKCLTQPWLDVMKEAHKLNLVTSATMMFGHIETYEERLQHLIHIRDVQAEKPEGHHGFKAFIPWPYQDEGTTLRRIRDIRNEVTSEEYVRMIAISRIMLPNVDNIQASWLTIGKKTAQLCLHAGANDFGSIMIEENVVSAAGAPHRFTANSMQEAIREAGFEPQLRNQDYTYRAIPEVIEEQVINY